MMNACAGDAAPLSEMACETAIADYQLMQPASARHNRTLNRRLAGRSHKAAALINIFRTALSRRPVVVASWK